MSFSADIEGLDRLKASMERVREAVMGDAALLSIAGEAREKVLVRTFAGQDIYGAEFTPYSMGYQETKENRGGDGGVVDLKLTGRMLSDISIGAEGGEAAIFFKNAESEAKAAWHNDGEAGDGTPRRAFFGLSDEDGDYLEGLFYEYAGRVIEEAIKG